MARRRVSILENPLASLIANDDRDDLHRAIGRFIFEYSQLEFLLRRILRHKLGIKMDHDDVVTAAFDFAKLCTAIVELSAIEEGGKPDRKLKDLIGDCHDVNGIRIAVVHGRWISTLAGDQVLHKRTIKLDEEGKLDRESDGIGRLRERITEVAHAGDERRKRKAANSR
jgi:hypothetical protein